MKEEISICWLRRDLRLEDNVSLFEVSKSSDKVLLVFIFDTTILNKLEDKADRRVAFIHESLLSINQRIKKYGSSLWIVHNSPLAAFQELNNQFDVKAIFTNRDYEPGAIERDKLIEEFAYANKIAFKTYKDQVIFEKSEITKRDGTPYTVFTPYANAWKQQLTKQTEVSYPSEMMLSRLYQRDNLPFPTLNEIGFQDIPSGVGENPEIDTGFLTHYHETRNFPAVDSTSKLGVHLRFGTISIRKLVKAARDINDTWLNELIWREFFMMILYHFPEVEHRAFRKKYDAIRWRNNEDEFQLWCKGETGYPLVDAGMRQLNASGWMHNRVRMIVASFLTKHLLIDWRWGEAYFAGKLLDYELSSNNGNWQWAAGCGCDAAPYFRVFNPGLQAKKFDPDQVYIRRWIADYDTNYPPAMIDHEFARKRALTVYKESL